MAGETFDAFCPTCNMQVTTRVIASGYGGSSLSAFNSIDEEDVEYHGDCFFVALCTRCSSPFLVKQLRYTIAGDFESITKETILFPVESRLPLDGIPEPIKRAYEQALRSYAASLYEPSSLICRRCLEALAKSLGAQRGNLQEKLDSLKASGHIDSRLVKWAHCIRILGNEAAHDTDMMVTKEDEKDALEFTEALLLYVFLLNKRFEAFQSRRGNDKNE